MSKLGIYIIISLFVFVQSVFAESLVVTYFERPPYYYTENLNASGFLIDLSRKIFNDAGIEMDFMMLPPTRILTSIKEDDSYMCSMGWFISPERLKFAKFSLPIYQNKPIVILAARENETLLRSFHTLHDLFQDKSLIFTKIKSFSYGAYIDQLIQKTSPNIHNVSSKQYLLPKLIKAGRVTYMLIAPEEFESVLKTAKLDPADFITLSKPDIPHGNKRHIMFSRTVSDLVIKKINTSIKKLAYQKP